jgi:hypothetical protein
MEIEGKNLINKTDLFFLKDDFIFKIMWLKSTFLINPISYKNVNQNPHTVHERKVFLEPMMSVKRVILIP